MDKHAPLELRSERWRALVAPTCGGGLLRLDWLSAADAVPVLRAAADKNPVDPNRMACYPLVPWSNRLGGLGLPKGRSACAGTSPVPLNCPGERFPIHGDAWRASWSVVERTDAAVTLRHTGQSWLPFAYVAEMRYILDGDRFRCELSARNVGEDDAPFGLGLHPFFARTPQMRLRLKARHTWPPLANRLPGRCVSVAAADIPADGQWRGLPDEELDHCVGGWDGRAEIAWPEHRLTGVVETWPPAPFFVLYAPPQADFFCLEPVTHANGAHRQQPGGGDLGLRWLSPGERMQLEVELRLFDGGTAPHDKTMERTRW